MVTQFLHTKYHMPPPRANGIRRSRLGERLQYGLLAGHKLTLISAPAGYGKTTLAAAWVQQAALPIAWLSLDEQDNDFERFLAYLLLALQKIGDNAGSHLRAALDATQLPPLEEIAANLCHDLEEMGQAVTGGGERPFPPRSRRLPQNPPAPHPRPAQPAAGASAARLRPAAPQPRRPTPASAPPARAW